MKLHTGETQFNATKDWEWDDRKKLGQNFLRELAEDILNSLSDETDSYYRKRYAAFKTEIVRTLELDGYLYRDRTVLLSESTVLDVEEEIGILEHLHTKLSLNNRDAAFTFLKLSEEHYVAGKWSDSIANSRKFFESVMQEIAAAHELRKSGSPLTDRTFSRPFAVRDYLENEGLLENKEKETIAKVYGLLSHTGGHPYMAEEDQARLLRQLALTITQFAMLRYEASLGTHATA